jgi:aquaporin Z
MLSAAVCATLLQHPASPLASWSAGPLVRRVLMGLAMGATAVGLIYSPFGKRSGAHMNPAVTLAFLRLGKIAPVDAVGYVAAQFVGGTVGLVLAIGLLDGLLADPSVNYVATVPGSWGVPPAFGAETAIAFLMMQMVLTVSNTPQLARYTGLGAGILVALFIAFEAPVSGMSMNPARTLGSNLFAAASSTLWLYFSAPLLGMLLAAELFIRRRGRAQVRCAKLHHTFDTRCIFRCGYAAPTEVG